MREMNVAPDGPKLVGEHGVPTGSFLYRKTIPLLPHFLQEDQAPACAEAVADFALAH